MSFKFVDLFAGIGGFHAALSAMGGECVYAVENDQRAAAVYLKNWGIDPTGDITVTATDKVMKVPRHDVLVAGFPCQPFSKSGSQRGMEETRGTLYWNILQIVSQRRPKLVLLENVRNLVGPRHVHEWEVIVQTLRAEGYAITDEPCILSPHQLPPKMGGRPQARERVFISAVRSPRRDRPIEARPISDLRTKTGDWSTDKWDLTSTGVLSSDVVDTRFSLSADEMYWIDAWDDFVVQMYSFRGQRLPGFPLWGELWKPKSRLRIPAGTPTWKEDFLRKNSNFYRDHREIIDPWVEKWDFHGPRFPASRRKLEWQAQDTPTLWETVMHLRPSGIRAKRATYLPALVAITQTSIIGPLKRRITPDEAKALQGLPDWFDISDQPDSAAYKQLGNGVNVGCVWYVLRETVNTYHDVFEKTCPTLLSAIESSPIRPDDILESMARPMV